jgi:uracil-DNA glycosylase family 4
LSSKNEILEQLGITPIWRSSNPECGGVVASSDVKSSSESDEAAKTIGRGEPRDVTWGSLSEAVSGCQSCALFETRKKVVIGVGDRDANWLFVGEAPGAEEDEKGEPFVGRAGQLLDNMLRAIRLERGKNVYIANVVKCRPPENRNPTDVEIRACTQFLDQQIDLINPKVIVALGRIAAERLVDYPGSLSKSRLTRFDYRGIPVVVTYHPAYLLRSPLDKSKAWEDLCFAVDTMREVAQVVEVTQKETV